MLVVFLSLLGCAAPIEAPTELSALSAWLYAAHDDEESLSVGLDSLRGWLDDPPEDGYLLAPLAAGDLDSISHPGRDPGDCIGIAISSQSPFSPAAHVELMLLEDLTPISPTAERFDRTFTTDPGCFRDGCETLETVNDIFRSNLLMSMGFTIYKDHRRVTLPDGSEALVARGWMAESAHGEDGNNHLWQSYELDVWLPSSDGSETTRMMAMWSEGEYSGVSDDLAISLLRMGLRDALEAQDEYLTAR